MDFWVRWRRMSNRLSGALVAAFGLVAVVGGVQLWRSEGPPVVAALFALVGAAMLFALWRYRT